MKNNDFKEVTQFAGYIVLTTVIHILNAYT